MADKKTDTDTPEYEAAYQAAFTETPAETIALGEFDGKFHWTYKLRDLDSVNDPGQLEANQAEVERQALNLGWLVTEPATIVATVADDAPDTRGGGSVTYAAPCVPNTLENRPV